MTKSGSQLISDEYKAQLQEKHGTDDQWGNTSLNHYKTIVQFIDHYKIKSILDYGCGKGMIGKKFREDQENGLYPGIEFFEYDPGIPGKTDPDTKGDLLINTDVLEHIEPELIDNVLTDMAARCQRVAFIVINCVPAHHFLPDGRNAHLIVEDKPWWEAKLKKHFNVIQAERHGTDLYVVALRKEKNMQTKKKPAEIERAIKTAQTHISNGNLAHARLALQNVDDIDALFMQGEIAFQTDDISTAANAFLVCLKATGSPEAARYLGLSLTKMGRYTDALKCLDTPECRAAFSQDEDYLAALMQSWNMALLPDKTIALYRSMNRRNALLVDAYVRALIINQKYEESLEAAEKAANADPQDHLLWAILGYAADTNRKFAIATSANRKAVELAPDYAAHHSNLGLSLMHENKLDEAGAAYDRAIALDPLLSAAYLNRANIYRLQGNPEAEENALRQCLQIDPTLAEVQYGLGICLLRQERYREGFAHIEWFWHKATLTSTRLPTSYRRWFGEDLTGKNLLVFADQGVGDTIMMLRYIPDLLARGPQTIVLNVNNKLRPMVEHQYAAEIAAGRILVFEDSMRIGSEHVQFSVAATSLPHAMNTTISSIPHPGGYLTKKRTIDYKQGNPDCFVIGISWYTKSMDTGFRRSLQLMDFSFLSHYPNVRVINLQYGDTAVERAQAKEQGFDVHHDETVDAWADLQDSIDQIAACDLVISIDNTTVHTAGALGVPGWVILPSEPFWRWPIHGETSPWYDSLRLFRHDGKNEYTHTVADVKAALDKFFSGDKTQLLPPRFEPQFPPEDAQKTALLVNDTSSCFTWGNYAGVTAIKNGLSEQGYEVRTVHFQELPWFAEHTPTLQDFDNPVFLSACRYRDPTLFFNLANADIVVFNGEGLMNGAGETARQMLYLAYVAKTVFGRRIAMINHSCFPEGGTQLTDPKALSWYLKVYKLFDYVCAREPATRDLLQSLQISSQLAADTSALPMLAYVQAHPPVERDRTVILTAGPGYETSQAPEFAKICRQLVQSGFKPEILIGAQWQSSQEDVLFAADLQEFARADVSTHRCPTEEDFMKKIAGARLVITGFYQTYIMAYTAGTPVIAVAGGSTAVALSSMARSLGEAEPVLMRTPDLANTLKNRIKTALSNPVGSMEGHLAKASELADSALKNLNTF